MERCFLEDLGCQFMKIALDNLVRDGYVQFAVLLLNKENQITPMTIDAPNSEARTALGDMLRTLAPHLNAIFMISEAWTLKPEDFTNEALTMPVSENPKRVEGVFVTTQSKNGELLLTTIFERDSNGKPVLSGDISKVWNTTSHREGNFNNLFASA